MAMTVIALRILLLSRAIPSRAACTRSPVRIFFHPSAPIWRTPSSSVAIRSLFPSRVIPSHRESQFTFSVYEPSAAIIGNSSIISATCAPGYGRLKAANTSRNKFPDEARRSRNAPKRDCFARRMEIRKSEHFSLALDSTLRVQHEGRIGENKRGTC